MNKTAFTILEIMIVLAVLAILFGIGIPSMKGARSQAMKGEIQAELKALQLAVEAYKSVHNAYPPTNLTDITATLHAEPQTIIHEMYGTDAGLPAQDYKYTLDAGELYYVICSVGLTGVGTCGISGMTVTPADGGMCVTNGTGC